MNKIKFTALVLTALMAISVLAGCSGSSGNNSGNSSENGSATIDATDLSGTVSVSSASGSFEPQGYRVLLKRNEEFDDLEGPDEFEIYPDLPEASADFTVNWSGNAPEDPEYFVFTEDFERIHRGTEWEIPSQPGTYLVRMDILWGDYDDYDQYWYYWKVVV